MLSLSKGEVVGEVFNIGTDKPITINKLTETLQKIMEKIFLKPFYAEPRPGDIKHSFGNITKARRILGYEPKVQLEKGLS
jgi:nucleoside-diphosphate-sugar epimerase